MLIALSIISFDPKKFSLLKSKNTYKNIFLIFLGVIHGLTNLGGGFLALYANINVKKNKNWNFYMPITSMILISLILTFLYRLGIGNFTK